MKIVINCTGSDTIELNQLTELQGTLKERNAQDLKKIIASIKKHGFSFPFFVWQHDNINHVLDGHGRLMALKQLQAEGVTVPALPCVYVSADDENEAKEKLLKLNSQYGTMTAESVAGFLDGLKLDFDELALPAGVLDLGKLEPEDTTNDDDAPDLKPDEVADSQRGQLYCLGKHRLYCGDSCSAEDMAALMGGSKADLIVTDPPYNVDLWNLSPEKAKKLHHRQDGLKIENDKMDDAGFKEFLIKAFRTMFGALKAGGSFYIWHADMKGQIFREALKEAGGEMHQVLIWVKNRLSMSFSNWQWRHEPCLYGWKAGASHYWDGRRDLTTVFDDKPNYSKMNKEQLLQEITKLRGDNLPSTIIYEDKPARNEEHPTMKPVNLFTRLIKESSKADDVVLDPFGGSGTTIIAAEKLNRTAYVMELDPHYCDVIRKRWTKWAEENGVNAGSGALK
ncbi:MAG: DNA modification methylase [Clostridia bacterium]|nr:DNA modification methylase [Clostridia bacterium]